MTLRKYRTTKYMTKNSNIMTLHYKNNDKTSIIIQEDYK